MVLRLCKLVSSIITCSSKPDHFVFSTRAFTFLAAILNPCEPKTPNHELAFSWQGYALRLVGHSLGGGTAAVTTILLRDQPDLVGVPPKKISAVCFSPPACLSRSLADRTSAFARTLVMQDDVIPRASARAMDRLRREVERTDWWVA